MNFPRMSLMLLILGCPVADSAAYFKGLHASSQVPLLANGTSFAAIYHELENAEKVIEFDHSPEKNKNKAIYVFLAMFGLTNYCGIDRCFLGSIAVGVTKGCCCFNGCFVSNVLLQTTGMPLCAPCGCVIAIWVMIDFWCAAIAALMMTENLQDFKMFGLEAEFQKNSLDAAFYVAVIFLCLAVCLPFLILCVYACFFACFMGMAMSCGAAPPDFDVDKQPQNIGEHKDLVRTMTGNMKDKALTKMPMTMTKLLRQTKQLSETPGPAEIERLFAAADTNNDKTLDKAEFLAAFATIGVGEEEAEKMFSKADKNSDGKLSLDEFMDSITSSKDSEKAAPQEASA